MTVISKRAVDVFAPTTAGGQPRGADMGDAMIWGTEIERATDGATAGRIDQVAWAELATVVGTRPGQPAIVVGPDFGTHVDPVTGLTVPNVGEYYWSTAPAGWRRLGNLQRTLVHAINSGTGTANAILATADMQFSHTAYAALITINFTVANTGAMTLAIDGEAPRALVLNTGLSIPAGYVRPNMSALVQIDSTGNYRLFSYGDAMAIQAAVEAVLADFRTQHLGRYSANPITDPAGNALQQGAFYWNTIAKAWLYWDGDSFEGFPFATVADDTITLQKLTPSLKATIGALGQKIVILAVGQSNIAILETLAWTPPKNLYVWNWAGVDETTVGTAFAPADPTKSGCGHSYAAEVAKENPGAAVYLINIGRGSQAIAQWMAGAATPKMFDASKINVEAALTLLGVDHIDRVLWWQGEADFQAGYGTYSQYPANFETVMARYYSQSWCPPSTPVIVMATSHFYVTGTMDRVFNPILRQVVDADPQRRTYVGLKALGNTYWNPTGDAIHMVGVGYREAGRLAYQNGERGIGQNRKSTSVIRRFKPTTDVITSNAALSPDGDLMVFLRTTCRVKFIVFGDTSLAAGFKWNITGPAGGYIGWRARWVLENFPTVENIAMGSGYPVPQAFTNPSGKFMLEVDLFHNGPTGAADNLIFNRSQTTANAASTLVLATSGIEMVESA